jgi:hypothetical protein
MHAATRFSDVFLNTAKVIFLSHTALTRWRSKCPNPHRRYTSARSLVMITAPIRPPVYPSVDASNTAWCQRSPYHRFRRIQGH